MKKINIERKLTEALRDKKLPILTLDARWHTLFSEGKKPPVVAELETNLNDLLKEQGKLVNELKDLKRAKKQKMDEIVANMGSLSEKQSKQVQRLIQELNDRIEEDSDRLMDLPYKIKQVNEQLLVTGMTFCYNQMEQTKEEYDTLQEEINVMREILKSKVAYKVALEEQHNNTYTCLHDILGPQVMELFDNK